MDIELVVFDMAGTTVDEQNVVYKTVHQAILRAGVEVSLEAVLLHAAGKEKFQAILDVLEATTGAPFEVEKAKLIFQDFETLLDKAYNELLPKAMPGAEQVFGILQERGIAVALNTGYKRTVAEGLLQKLAWKEGHTFGLLVTANDAPRSRPHPDMIHVAMRHFGVKDPKKVAKIGDSIVDIEEGINAGCGICAGITTGAQTAAQLWTAHPSQVFDSLEELLYLV
ncbi:MAG: phosphonatase-like hydrolase [Saprospiraceae bacterium]|nr:phosphonatase-like hydrolase [Saprospiraceae bacterium]MDZ4706750.1 phosphonatase-like hydrolase [Saprospiraceae bacterium]